MRHHTNLLFKKARSRMLQTCIFLAIFSLFSIETNASSGCLYNSSQQSFHKKITGIVYNKSTKHTLPGVNVMLKSSTLGTITDTNGKFELVVNRLKGEIIFSFIGYKTQIIDISTINTSKAIKIALKEDAKLLDDVNVVGKTDYSRKNMATNVITVSPKSFAKRPLSNISEALDGNVAGLFYTTNGSVQPGDKEDFTLRGTSSLGGGLSSPLVLVDGIPTDINDVDISMVKSIKVLKDVTARAEYGPKATGGVILIETTRGDYGKITASYNEFTGIVKPLKVEDKPDARNYLNFLNEFKKGASFSKDDINNYVKAYGEKGVPWKKGVIKDHSFFTNHSLMISGGNGLARMSLTLNYMSQNGLLQIDNYKRYQGRFNSTIDISNKVSLKTDMSMRRVIQKEAVATNSEILSGLAMMQPIDAIRYTKASKAVMPTLIDKMIGNYLLYDDGFNPYLRARRGYIRLEYEFASILINPEWKINKNFTAGAQVSYQLNGHKQYLHANSEVFFNPDGSFFKKLDRQRGRATSIDATNLFTKAYLNYAKTWNNIDINATLGNYTEKYGAELASNSYYLKASFGLYNKLFIDAALQYNGSSKFRNNKFGAFPSVSLGYDFSKESFIQSLGLFNNLRLRASYGSSSSATNYNYLGYEDISGSGEYNNVANPDITWETIHEYSGGLDLAMDKSRFTFTTDVFKKKLYDLVLNKPLAASLGFANAIAKGNIGSINTYGWELTLGWNDRINKFSYGVNINISDSHNKVTSIGSYDKLYSGDDIWEVGHSSSSMYGYVADGYYQEKDFTTDANGNKVLKPGVVAYSGGQQAGEIKFKDLNGDGVVKNADDRAIIGNWAPRYYYGININIGYGAWSLSAQGKGVGKIDGVLNGGYRQPFNRKDTPLKTFIGNTWTPTHTDAKYPIALQTSHTNYLLSSRWMSDASYFRISNVSLSYNVPKSFLKKIHLRGASLSASATNLATYTNFEGLDPENLGGGPYSYPNGKKYSLGATIQF